MTIQEFNEKYNHLNYNLTEITDYDAECDDYRYLMTHTYEGWTHPEAGFTTIDKAAEYIEYMKAKEAEENPNLIY